MERTGIGLRFIDYVATSSVGATRPSSRRVGVWACVVVMIPVGSFVCLFVCEQALADPLGGWATLELRHDRAYRSWMHAVMQGIPNLCVMVRMNECQVMACFLVCVGLRRHADSLCWE